MKHLLALSILGFAAGCISIHDSGGGSRFVRSPSPTSMGEAIFTKDIGLQDTAVNFEVVDPKIGKKPISIGFVGDENWKGTMPKKAAWSKDGSVIAVQGAEFKDWSHVYDFKKHDYALADIYPPDKRAAAIENLLKSRGGIGPKVMNDWTKFDQVAQPVAENGR